MATAVVTGAAGFLGAAFQRSLSAQGWEVSGVDLRPGPGIVHGDVRRPDAWVDALDGADLVIHTAAIVKEFGDEQEFWDVNVGGTRTVLEAAAAAGVGRALHVSSIVVYGADFPDRADETTPVRMSGNPYTDTKVASEHEALRIGMSGRVPVTVIRPGDVYGPGSQPWTVRVLDLLRRGLFVLVDGGRGILTPTYVDDIVEGGIAAATDPAGAGEVFNITGGEAVPVGDFVRPFADALGVELRSVPRPLAWTAMAGIAAAYRAIGREPPVAPPALEYLSHPGTYSIDKADRLLGWRPKVPFEEGARRTLDWARTQGLLDER